MEQKRTSRTFIASTLVIAGLGIAALGIGTTYAAAQEQGGPHQAIVTAIAEKFNLSVDDVQAVFDQHRSDIIEEKRANAQEHLAQAVENGKLTQEQADAITQHHEDMQEFRESLRDMTPEERHDAMEEHRKEMKQWAEDNNITLPEFRKDRGPGKERFNMKAHYNQQDDASEETD